MDGLFEWTFLSMIIEAFSVCFEAHAQYAGSLRYVTSMFASAGDLIVEIQKLQLIRGSTPGNDAFRLAKGIKDDKCFTLGQGADVMKELHDELEFMHRFTIGLIAGACLQILFAVWNCYAESACRRAWKRRLFKRGGHTPIGLGGKKRPKLSLPLQVFKELASCVLTLGAHWWCDEEESVERRNEGEPVGEGPQNKEDGSGKKKRMTWGTCTFWCIAIVDLAGTMYDFFGNADALRSEFNEV